MTIQENLEQLIETKIVSYSMDILKNSFSLSLELLENGTITHYEVEFIDICTFYFINNTTDERKDILSYEENDYLELTSIDLTDKSVHISLRSETDAWLKQYNGCGNFTLEIWSKLIVLEAKKIKINDNVYKV